MPLDNLATTGLSRLLHMETAAVSAQFCDKTWVQRMSVLSGQENPVPSTRRPSGYIMKIAEGSGTSPSLINLTVSVEVKHHVYFRGTLAIWLSD